MSAKGGKAGANNTLRACARTVLQRISAGERLLPRGAGVGACAIFYALTGIYGIALNGALDGPKTALTQGLDAASGLTPLRIREITISGATPDRQAEVARVLGIGGGDSVIFFDAGEARQRVEALPFVKHAEVLRLLLGAVHVKIAEREPYAVWQWQGEVAVIDSEGVVIGTATRNDYASLPLVVGTGANDHAGELFAALARWPALRPRMRAAVRVANRRWNIRLFNGVDVRLPEDNLAAAIDELAALEETYGLLQRDIVAVDLRLSDRITIRLSEDAAAERRAGLKVSKSKRGGADT
jgi:cell division protein FtsQ